MITVVCTNRGQHPSLWLAEVREDDPMRPRRNYRRLSPAEERAWTERSERPPPATVSYPFRCNACDRDVQMRAETWRQVVEAYIGAGMTKLDVSRLPF